MSSRESERDEDNVVLIRSSLCSFCLKHSDNTEDLAADKKLLINRVNPTGSEEIIGNRLTDNRDWKSRLSIIIAKPCSLSNFPASNTLIIRIDSLNLCGRMLVAIDDLSVHQKHWTHMRNMRNLRDGIHIRYREL